jgi:hypothetical protein
VVCQFDPNPLEEEAESGEVLASTFLSIKQVCLVLPDLLRDQLVRAAGCSTERIPTPHLGTFLQSRGINCDAEVPPASVRHTMDQRKPLRELPYKRYSTPQTL